MTNRQKVEALRDEIRHQHCEDECNQWSMDGFTRRLDAILADWPEEPAKKDVEDIAPKLVRIALCTTTGSGNAYYALIPETKRHAIEAIVYAMREEGL